MKKVFWIIGVVVCCFGRAGAQETPDLRWQFADKTSVTDTSNLQDVTFGKDGMKAQTEFDPFFYLALPQKEINAKQYRYLSVQLYSSEPANNLAIYYKSPNGNWGLASTPFPVEKGWHQYVVDMETQAQWAKSADAAATPVWGGTEKLIDKLRLDPGDDKGREIKIREVVLSAKPIVIPPVTSWQWKEAGDLLKWTPANFAMLEAKDGVLRGQTKYDAQLLSPPLGIEAEQWPVLEFRLKSNKNGEGQIFFRRDGEAMSDGRRVSFSIASDNQFHIYRVNLAADKQWQGTIAQIRFDPLDPAGAQIEVQYLRLLPKNIGGLIHNGGFEVADTTSARPEGWTFANVQPQTVAGENSAQAVQLAAGAQAGRLQSAQFEFPSTGQHQLKVDYRSGVQAKSLTGKLLYFDVFHKPLPSSSLALTVSPSGKWQTLESTLAVPPLAAYGQIAFEVPPASQITLDNIALKLTREPVPAWAERWRASWIMAPDAGTQPKAARYFRKEFTLPAGAAVTAAKIQATGDDEVRVFINGHELPNGANWNNWRLADVYDLKPYLQADKNVLGLVMRNERSSEGVIAEANVQYAGQELTLETDQSWSTLVGEADTDWTQSTFKTDAWKPALLLGTPPVAPWGELPYAYLGRKLPLQVQAFTAPAQAELGQKIKVQLNFIPQENPTHATALQLQLVPADTVSAASTFEFSPIPLDTAQWKKGASVRLNELVQLPRYFRSGEYSLRATLTFTAMDGKAEQRINLKSPAVAKPPVTKVVYLPGHVPAFDINGKILPVMHTMTNNTAVPAVQKQIIQNSRENNVNLIWLNVNEFDWQPDAPTTFKKMDEAVNAVLETNPQAYLVLNVPLEPYNNLGMKKWLDLHPDQLIRDDKGSTALSGYNNAPSRGEKYASFASKIWMDDATKSWRELIRHVRSGPYADRVIGYVPIAGISWEWFYFGSQGQDFTDYSQPFTQAFGNWAKAQYRGDLALLNKTWKTNYANFDAIQLPTKAQRSAAGYGEFLDPKQDAQSIDLREFITHLISGDILEFCHIVKEETQNTAICGTYYGYVMHIGRAYFGPHSGHFALSRVLASPDIDFVMSPSTYSDRGLGGASGFMIPVDSVKLHGKLYIDQADIRTLHATDPIGRVDTVQDSVSMLQREFANNVVNGGAPQWYDFGNGWIAGDARLMQAVGKMWQVAKALQQTPRDTMDAPNSIAVITGEKSILYTKVDSMLNYTATSEQIAGLNRIGAAWDNYLLSDLPKIGKYRVYLFVNCFDITDEQKKYIDQNLKKDGNVLVWVSAAGIVRSEDGSTYGQATYDLKRVNEVTGFNLQQLPDGQLATRLLPGDNPLQRGAEDIVFGNSRVIGPRFAAQDGVALGSFNDNAQTALAVKRFDNWTSVYSSTPNLPAALLRNIATLGKVPVINDREGDVTYVSKNLFAMHSLGGGERIFRVGAQYKTAKELFSDKTYPVQNGRFTATVPAGGTTLFLLRN
jgi:hypothetical protein